MIHDSCPLWYGVAMKLHAKKSLGQHFLNSENVLRKIIAAAAIKEGEVVLEIGPGTGVLTRGLLKAGAKVIAIEKDHRAYVMLGLTFSSEISTGRLKLVEGDILDPDDIPAIPDSKYALVANIPYYITGAILKRFLEGSPRPNRMVLLVQKEVAERIVARDGKESILSISVKAFGRPKIIAAVPRGAFTPPPSVDSAILAIADISDNRFRASGVGIERFFTVLHAGFSHKRKLLARNLEEVMDKETVNRLWNELNLDPKVRAEDVPVETWFDIAKCA